MMYAVHFTRGRRGYALVSTLVVGLLSTALLLSLSSFLVSVSQSESARRHKAEMRHAAEAAIEYALGDLGTGASALDASPGLPSRTTIIPTSLLVGTAGGISNSAVLNQMNVSVTVRALTKTEMSQFSSWSPLYSKAIDPNLERSIAYDPTQLNGDYTLWRVIEAKASMGGINRTIRVLAEPMFELTADKLIGSTNNGNYFKYGAFGDEVLNLADAGIVSWAGSKPKDSSGKNFSLTVASNGKVELGLATVLQGNVSQFSSDNYLMQSTSLIYGQLLTNASTNGASRRFPKVDLPPPNQPQPIFYDSSSPHPNVLDGAESIIQFQGDGTVELNTSGAEGNPIDSAGGSKAVLPPVPTGTDAQSLPSLQEVSQSGSQYVSTTGDWKASSLATSEGMSSINVSDTLLQPDSSTPNRIFIDDSSINSGSTRNAVSIDTSIFRHEADPTSLQIWYDGSRDVEIRIPTNKSFAATVFAPNAKVTIKGKALNQAGGEFIGAVTGREVVILNGVNLKLLSDPAFTDNAAGPAKNSGLSYSKGSSPSDPPPPTGYRIVTWQEIN
ncbi:MAG: hypothetical protein JNN26_14045 [Candidatus Obscuribacter sp.]|nr:hypothetical protein [Candidatus Obscuribacter sp.]